MSINDIDKILNKILDDFYVSQINNNKILNKIIVDDNFSKQSRTLIGIIDKYAKIIDFSHLRKIVVSEDNVIFLTKLVTKYICYYLFIWIRFIYAKNEYVYINNLLDVTRDSTTYNFYVDGFFTSNSNSEVIKYGKLLYDIVYVLENVNTNKEIHKNKEYLSSLMFLNELGLNYVNENFKTDNKNDNVHNVAKTIIINKIYIKEDRPVVNKLIEDISLNIGEYIYIDVVVQKNSIINSNAINDVLTRREIKYDIGNNLYSLIEKTNNLANILNNYVNIEEKISLLFSSKIVVPVVDDFMMYHKDGEKYEFQKSKLKTSDKKQSLTKVKYIVDKIDNATSINDKNDTNATIWYLPNIYNKYLLINYYENLNILSKILLLGKITENQEYYSDFYEYLGYAFVNFKEPTNYSFRMHFQETTDVVRLSKNNKIFCRTGTKTNPVDICGLLFNSSCQPIECVTLNKNSNINEKHVNSFDYFVDAIKNVILNDQKLKPIIWTFDFDKYETASNTYEKLNNVTNSEISKIMMAQLYDKFVEIVFNLIVSIYEKHTYLSIQTMDDIKKLIEKKFIKIHDESIYNLKLQELMYFKKSQIKIGKNIEDIILTQTDTIKLSEPTKKYEKIKKYIVTDKITQNNVKKEMNNYVCQHEVTLNELSALKNINPSKLVNIIEEFIKQYIVVDNNSHNICKSCGSVINITEYDIDGKYDNENEFGRFVSFSYALNIDLEELPEYKNINKVIENIRNKTDKLLYIMNIQLFNDKQSKQRYTFFIKNTIDIIIENNNTLISTNKFNHDMSKYGLISGIANTFLTGFELNNLIYSHSTSDKNVAKTVVKNYIVAYIIVSLLFELNENHISMFKIGNKTCNFESFEKYGIHLFKKNKIIINNKYENDYITNFPTFCYVAYYFCCMLIKYDQWSFDENDTIKKEKLFAIKIKTVIDIVLLIINMIHLNRKKSEVMNNMSIKIFTKLYSLYSNKITIVPKQKHQNTVVDNSSNIEFIDPLNKKNRIINSVICFNYPDKKIHIKKRKPILNKSNTEYNYNDAIFKFKNTINIQSLMKFVCSFYDNISPTVCKNVKNNTITLQDIDNVVEQYSYLKKQDNEHSIQYVKIINETIKNTSNINEIYANYKKNNNFVSILVNNIVSITGNVVNFGAMSIDILNDIVTLVKHKIVQKFDYDIFIKENIMSSKKIQIKKNATEFPEKKGTKIFAIPLQKYEAYFDFVTHVFLGYKENGKYISVSDNIQSLNIERSFYNKLKYLGFKNTNYFNSTINEIFIDRLYNLKSILNLIKRTYNAVLNSNINFQDDLDDDEIELNLIKRHSNKFKSIKKLEIFENLNEILILQPTIVKDKSVHKYIYVDDIINDDTNGNIVQNYICDKLNLLIQNNENRIMKINIINFIVDIIDTIHYKYNDDNITTKLELKKFAYKLNSSEYMANDEQIDFSLSTQSNFYENSESEDDIDKHTKDELKEEMDAIDIDGDFDYDGNYEMLNK